MAVLVFRPTGSGEEKEEEAQKVHDVIMPLMHVSDLVALGASHVICAKEVPSAALTLCFLFR